MDALIAAASRALTAGDPLQALKQVALRQDPPALALRGIAMAQLGELTRARELLRLARRRFGPHEVLARARCTVAEAEVALALRLLNESPRPVQMAAALLADRGDRANAAQASLIAARRLLLLGRLSESAQTLSGVDLTGLNAPALQAMAELTQAEIALRRWRSDEAQAALARAEMVAARAGIVALQAEVRLLAASARQPAARRIQAGQVRPVQLQEVAALVAAGSLVVDGCRRALKAGARWQSLARRPVLFTLAGALAEHWPAEVSREALIARAFRISRPDETDRVRLRVQLGRLRPLLEPAARIEPTARGYRLVALQEGPIVVLQPPVEGETASLQALLADGLAWSSSALALALGESQRNIQRALGELQAVGQVRSIGQGRSQRWLSAPMSGITTILLLPGSMPFP